MARVLVTGFCAVPGPRRAGVQLRQVIRALSPLHSVDLLVVREGDQPYVERQGAVRVLRVPTHASDLRSEIQAFQRALKRQLDGADYDVVHCRDSWSALPVLEARARLGYAVVYDLTRSPLGETSADAELDAQATREEEACLAAADLVLAPTPAAVRALQGRIPPERVLLAPPGVDIDRFDWEDPAPGSPPRILYAGSIDAGRGVRVLVRAMAAILREVDARLVIAGAMDPKFDAALREGAREPHLAGKVEVLAPVDHDQIPALIATATVCVVPAAADLSPNPSVVYPTKLLEYMACKRPVVAPRRESIAQVVENNREALLFEPGDPVDLARKVLRILGEPLLRDRLAQGAYERVRRDFTASAARRAIRRAYGVLAQRFAIAAEPRDDDAPKPELLVDDDFEATVFEEVPAPPVEPAARSAGPASAPRAGSPSLRDAGRGGASPARAGARVDPRLLALDPPIDPPIDPPVRAAFGSIAGAPPPGGGEALVAAGPGAAAVPASATSRPSPRPALAALGGPATGGATAAGIAGALSPLPRAGTLSGPPGLGSPKALGPGSLGEPPRGLPAAPAPGGPESGDLSAEVSLDDALVMLDAEGGGSTSSESLIAPPALDETVERPPIVLHHRADHDSGAWTTSALVAAPALGTDDWVVTSVAAVVRALDEGDPQGDDGTPIEGVVAVAPALPMHGAFVAGEIDVPPSRPEREPARFDDAPLVELTASSAVIAIDVDPDTGSRTPPIERR
jgi:glycosyltransferase involved in cell wall biosynthesis